MVRIIEVSMVKGAQSTKSVSGETFAEAVDKFSKGELELVEVKAKKKPNKEEGK